MDVVALIPLAEKIGKEIAREWPGIEAEDISQTILLHVLEPANNFAANEYDDNTIEAVLRTVGTRYASSERYAYTFNSAQYVYTPAEVRALLEEAFYDPASWEDAPKKETDHRLSVAGGGVVVALWDLRDAFDKLPGKYQAAIERRYATHEDMSDAERKRVERAIDSLTRSLNQKVAAASAEDFDGPGSRTAVSNAQAQAQTRNIY